MQIQKDKIKIISVLFTLLVMDVSKCQFCEKFKMVDIGLRKITSDTSYRNQEKHILLD